MRPTVFASFLAPLALAAFAHAAIVTTNVPIAAYTGTAGASQNGIGDTGGAGKTLTGGTFNVTGGTFTGGAGGFGRFYTKIDTFDFGDTYETFYTDINGMGGQGGAGLAVTGTTFATISGGTFTGSAAGAGQPDVDYTLGQGYALSLVNGANAQVTGGTFNGAFSARQGSTLTLYGTFSLPTGTVLKENQGTFSGKLGTSSVSQSFQWYAAEGSTITLAAVPEPTSLAALAGVAIVALRRRR